MIIYPSRIIAYFCPQCAQINIQRISIFDITHSPSILTCSVPECRLPVLYTERRRGKYIFRLPCPICGDMHEFRADADKLWTKELFIFQCPEDEWGELSDHILPEENGILYIGTTEAALSAVAQNRIFCRSRSEKSYRLKRLCAIIKHLSVLLENDGISCGCQHPNIHIGSLGTDALVCCINCGRKMLISSDAQNRDKILSMDALTLDSSSPGVSKHKNV